jgi:flagellar biosynthesis GTPase FlhF
MRDEKEEEKRKQYEKELQETKEKEKKKEELNKLFKEKVETIKSNKFSEIEKEFEANKNNFCSEEISKYDKSEINLFLKTFLKTEKVAKFILDLLIQLVSLNKEIIKNIEHLNIVLVGPSGGQINFNKCNT